MGSGSERRAPLTLPKSTKDTTVSDFPWPSKNKAICLIGLGLTHTLFTAGVIFGWAALEEELLKEGMFSDVCGDEAVKAASEEGVSEALCPKQASHMTLTLTLGASANYLSNIVFGMVLDKYGPRIGSLSAISVFAVGIFLSSMNGVAFIMGMIFIAFSGPGVQIATFHLANLFPSWKGRIMQLQTSAFDASTVVFLVIATIVDTSSITREAAFRGYLLVPAFLFVSALLFWPNRPFPQKETTSSATSTAAEEKPIFEKLSGKEQLTHRAFVGISLFVSVHILKLNFIVGTLNSQLALLGVTDKHVYIDAFSILLPFGFIVAPLGGWLLDKKNYTWSLNLVNVTALAYSGCVVLAEGDPAFLFPAFVLIAISRQLVYSLAFHLLAHWFGFVHYGKLIGCLNIIVTIIGLLQYALSAIALSMDSYLLVNIVLAALVAPTMLIQPTLFRGI